LTDIELVASILAGDMRALETLMRLYNRTLLRAARSILRNSAEAEDAVQETFLRAYRALGTFRGESKLSTWLVRIAVNEALMRRRGAKPEALTDRETDELVSGEAGPESTALRRDLGKRLIEQVERLPEEFQAVFRLRALEELTVEETAAALGIPQATVRTRYFRARALLRKSLQRQGDRPSSLESSLVIIEKDLGRLRSLRPHAALLREIGRATVVSPKEAASLKAVTMNSQVCYTDDTSGGERDVNIVYPHEAGRCACSVSILAPIGTALIGLSAGQAIEWDFPDGTHRRLLVNRVIQGDCARLSPAGVPRAKSLAAATAGASRTARSATSPGR
jgi:RNA polymerase sigma-70 factor (ECF subfamily)